MQLERLIFASVGGRQSGHTGVTTGCDSCMSSLASSNIVKEPVAALRGGQGATPSPPVRGLSVPLRPSIKLVASGCKIAMLHNSYI